MNSVAIQPFPVRQCVTQLKENGHERASAPNGAMGLNLWGSLTSKLDGYPIDLNPSPAGPSQSMKKIASA